GGRGRGGGVSDPRGKEAGFEGATIERLKLLGYEHVRGPDLDREFTEVVLVDVLRDNLRARYPDLSETDVSAAVERITRPPGADLLHRNLSFHTEILTQGFELRVEGGGLGGDVQRVGAPLLTGSPNPEVAHIHPVDWEHPERNRFQVVSQLRIA